MSKEKNQSSAGRKLGLDAAQLAAFVENAPYAIQIFDLEGHSIYVNPAYLAVWSMPPPPEWSVFEDEQLQEKGAGPDLERVRHGEAVTFSPV